jgi:hypothetical protein
LRGHKASSYDYYHIISGTDIPLKTQDEIYHFLEVNNGKQFIAIGQEITNECLFARKFATSVDKEIVKKLYYRLLPPETVDNILK